MYYINMANTQKLLTLREAAELLNVHIRTLQRWDESGVLVAIRVGTGRHRRYRREDIERLLKKGTNGGKS